MADNYFDESIYNFLPKVDDLIDKTRELNSMLNDILANSHSFECEINDVRHGDIVRLRSALERLSDRADNVVGLLFPDSTKEV